MVIARTQGADSSSRPADDRGGPELETCLVRLSGELDLTRTRSGNQDGPVLTRARLLAEDAHDSG